MNHRFKNILLGILMLLIPSISFAQLSNTLYFDKNNPRQHKVNPAMRPIGKFYVGIPFPFFPTFAVEAGNNRLTFGDIFQNVEVNGEMQTLLFCDKNNPDGMDNFLGKLKYNERVFASYQLDLIDFGFRIKEKGYLTFALSNRFESMVVLPKAIPNLLFVGMTQGQKFDTKINKLKVDASLFSQVSAGYSHVINDKLTVGGTFKYLYGHANASTDFSDARLVASGEDWTLKGDAYARLALPGLKFVPNEKNQIDEVSFEEFEDLKPYLKAQGHGAAIDLGMTYQLLPQLQLSASLVDLGFIRWSKNIQQLDKTNDFVFNGVEYDISTDTTDYFEDYEEQLNDMYEIGTPSAYTTSLSTKLHIGAEYSFWEDRIGLGVLSKTHFYCRSVWEEFLLSANFRPCKQFSLSLVYNMFDGQWSNLGAGMNFNLGAFNLNFAVDNIPMKYAAIKGADVKVPSNKSSVRAMLGVAYMFGYRKPKDSDNDGVADKFDKCPETMEGIAVDSLGCPKDTDKDGVPDYKDICPDSPLEAAGLVDSVGCPLDTDGDGVPDYKDQCVDTPVEAFNAIDSLGCPKDSDKDGVPDYIDRCANTPKEALVVAIDSLGCPLDSDKDGVSDYLDKCADTPAEAFGTVAETGCPKDSDEDGIYDYLDKCPDMKGVEAEGGCPEVKAEVKQVFKKALTGIQFESGRAVIKRSSYAVLDEIVRIMKENVDYKLNISGHTDSSGDAEKNQKLSEERAASVVDYLVSKGVDANRLRSSGFGSSKPVADNKTSAGRAKNRRVEFEVEY
jgi:outer membrane protein OmpA-like peptidoglycan-associated protein